MIVQRQKGKMIRSHYRTMRGCACAAWCEGYNEGRTDARNSGLAVALRLIERRIQAAEFWAQVSLANRQVLRLVQMDVETLMLELKRKITALEW